ncbi:MAG: ribonuclease R [Nitrospirota bacterium]
MKPTKKEFVSFFKNRAGRPLLVREIMRQFKLKADDRHDLKLMLAALVSEGHIVKSRGNRYGSAGGAAGPGKSVKAVLEQGIFQAHPSGFGFVMPGIKGKTDIFVPASGRRDAMDGDTVTVRVMPPSGKKAAGKREGVIIEVLERGHTRIVGTYEQVVTKGGTAGSVAPTNQRLTQNLIIPSGNAGGAKPGDLVSAGIVVYPSQGRPAEGKVLRVIGRPGDPGIESDLIIEEHELPVEFSPDTVAEAKAIPQAVSAAMRKNRRDLRDLPTVTIDGEKARDFDDAISIEKYRNGWRLWVHIADVAQYVQEGSLLDEEAYARATSVYLPDRAIPMLPEQLSNGICSLNPNVDRLTLTAEMDFDAEGSVVRHDIYESVINSNERMTYTGVRQILVDRDQAMRKRYEPLLRQFELMAELMEVLRAKRSKRGSIDFDLPEPEIVLDLQGQMTDIVRSERNMAHQLVEEFMLAANETVAAHIEDLEVPLIYRVHEEPAEEKLADLVDFLATIGITLPPADKLKPRNIQKAIASVKGTPEESLVNTVVLRTMKQARYSEENIGHFGLAAETYTHFTSPIRRYPDLIVHRIVKGVIHGKYRSEESREELADRLPASAVHCSQRERLAMDAERDVIAMLKVRFMEDKLGEVYDGIITGVTQFGLFVQLRELFVEGLVHVSSLKDDYYQYIENRHCLRGERRKRVYRIGDRIRVRVDRVDRERKRIDFSLIEE